MPQARFLGVTPQDIIDYKLEDATHPLEEVDIKRAKDALKNDPFIRHHKEWQEALKQMLKMGVRIEQQAFAKHGLNFVLERLPAREAEEAGVPAVTLTASGARLMSARAGCRSSSACAVEEGLDDLGVELRAAVLARFPPRLSSAVSGLR